MPFLQPRPVRLSRLVRELEAIETSGIYSNYGPVNARFEAALTARVFGGIGGCLTVNNATTGLMMAMREAVDRIGRGGYALMPSFTFAATAHAALWAGLKPLLCDVDRATWNACPEAEDFLLRKYRGQVACIVPYACFGNCLDLERYECLARDHGVGIVVDAAASLGSLDEHGRGFGTGFPHAVVFSMHVTKTFATSEGGVIHCGDAERLSRLRAMGNFGFERPREASMPGLNAKLSEIAALLALAKLETFEEIVAHRAALAASYREQLPGFDFQRPTGRKIAYQFVPVLVPDGSVGPRAAFMTALQGSGIGAAHYFSPHVAEQPYFAQTCAAGDLRVTQQIADRALSLPMWDTMEMPDVSTVCAVLRDCVARAS